MAKFLRFNIIDEPTAKFVPPDVVNYDAALAPTPEAVAPVVQSPAAASPAPEPQVDDSDGFCSAAATTSECT